MDAVVHVENLVKRFRDVTAVDGMSFAVGRGEFFGLLGPNGAGKSTTIRMLYGFSPPSAGSVRVFGLDIRTHWRTIKARIGVCHQENTLDPDLTVEENLWVFAGYFGLPLAVAKDRASELLDFFALSHKRRSKVADLSGGMARRLILARALINRPELLILDEPTTGLDPQSRHLLWDKLESLRADGITVLLTTHYMEEAARLCDRLVIMDHGKILVEGAPEALIARHAGAHVLEIGGPSRELRDYVRTEGLSHDDLGDRLILYVPEGSPLTETLRTRFCMERCTWRRSTLEDVFLRLTGRELRE
ncbi:MAG: ATP-binding cassette domain-containing protein [Desulfosoma sp.]